MIRTLLFFLLLVTSTRAADITLQLYFNDTNLNGIHDGSESIVSQDYVRWRCVPSYVPGPDFPTTGSYSMTFKPNSNVNGTTVTVGTRNFTGATTILTPILTTGLHSGFGAYSGGNTGVWYEQTFAATVAGNANLAGQTAAALHRVRFAAPIPGTASSGKTYTVDVPFVIRGQMEWLTYSVEVHSVSHLTNPKSFVIRIEGAEDRGFTIPASNPQKLGFGMHSYSDPNVEAGPKNYYVYKRIAPGVFDYSAPWASGQVQPDQVVKLFDGEGASQQNTAPPPDGTTPENVLETNNGTATGNSFNPTGNGISSGGTSGGSGGNTTTINTGGGAVNLEMDIYNDVKNALQDATAPETPIVGTGEPAEIGELEGEAPDVLAAAQALDQSERTAEADLRSKLDALKDKMVAPTLSTIDGVTLYQGAFQGQPVHLRVNFDQDSGGLVNIMRRLIHYAMGFVFLYLTASATRGYV